MNLLAGREADGTLNFFNLTVHGDELNATAIPITSLLADGEITQNHSVNIASGAQVRTARDANLIAERFGNATILAYGAGKNWLTAVASGIDSIAGSDGVSEKFLGGSSTNNLNAKVTICTDANQKGTCLTREINFKP